MFEGTQGDSHMERGLITAYCGEGRGKTGAALGQGILAAERGKSVIAIQFLKGRQQELELLDRLEPEFRIFRFEKFLKNYNELTPEEQAEEAANIRNALGFAKKVLVTGECDLLILDEILGLFDLNLMTIEEMKNLLAAKEEATELVVTGIHLKEELVPCIDKIYEIEPLKEQ